MTDTAFPVARNNVQISPEQAALNWELDKEFRKQPEIKWMIVHLVIAILLFAATICLVSAASKESFWGVENVISRLGEGGRWIPAGVTASAIVVLCYIVHQDMRALEAASDRIRKRLISRGTNAGINSGQSSSEIFEASNT